MDSGAGLAAVAKGELPSSAGNRSMIFTKIGLALMET
jgi:hypothetical protein